MQTVKCHMLEKSTVALGVSFAWLLLHDVHLSSLTVSSLHGRDHIKIT